MKCSAGRVYRITVNSLWICALHLTHPSAHTHSSEYTPRAVGSQCCSTRGAVGGSMPCSRVSPPSGYWRWKECSLFTPPHRKYLPDPRFEPTTPGYKSDAPSIGPQLPLCAKYMLFSLTYVSIPKNQIFFYVPQKNEIHSGLERHEGTFFMGEQSILLSFKIICSM